MSYYVHYKGVVKQVYKRISEFDGGLVQMKQNGFVYLIISKKEGQWENAVCLSTGQLESRVSIEEGYDQHQLGFIKVNGVIELKQVPDPYCEIEQIIANKVGWESAHEIMNEITTAELI